MPPPLPLGEVLADDGLRFWWRATRAPGLPPDGATWGEVPLRVLADYLYLTSSFG